MNILIADDHALLRGGLRQILSEDYPDAQFGEASTTAEALDCLTRQHWDVLILDIFMPGRTGLEVLHDVRHNHPGVPVLVLSSAPEEQLAIRVLRSGASGYLNKQAAPEELVAAIGRILAGGRYVSAAMAERLAAEIARPDQSPDVALSDREYSVLQLIVAGKSTQEIASEFSLSAKTISTFRSRICRKFGVHNDVEIVRYAREHRLAD